MDRGKAREATQRSLPARVIRRYLRADGMSHSRALAYETMLIVFSGFIGLLGVASLLDLEQVRGTVTELGRSIAPGPSGELLREAAASGARHGTTAAVFGLAAAALAGTIAMAEIERTGNRLAGLEQDRRLVFRYAMAFVLAVTVGLVFVAGGMALGAGRAIPVGAGWSDELRGIWSVARWPVGITVIAVAILLLFRFAPKADLGSWRSLFAGTVVAVVLWVAFTGLLSLYFSLASDSSPYGPLLAIVALMLWSMLGSLALAIGMATAAELSDARRPATEETVTIPEPPEPQRAPALMADPKTYGF
jgi:YihY family inner membrane protein